MAAKNQSDRAYEELRRRLLARSIRPGSRIKEAAWADELGVNRGDIRSALAQLKAEGAVVKGTRGGFFARSYDPEYVKELNEARLTLETAAAKLAIQRATDEDIRQLEAVCAQMKSMAENGYRLGLAEADVRFHTAFVNAAHNSKLLDVYRHADIPITEYPGPLDTPEAIREQLRADVDEHERIVQALRDKDLQRLVDILEKSMPLRRNG